MSRRRRKKPLPATHSPARKSTGGKQPPRMLIIILCLLPAVFFFTFGKYLEFNQPGPFDSGAYVYSAKHLLEGARLGVEEIPSAQPGTLLVNLIGVYCFGFSDAGSKIVQMVLQLAALAAMFFAGRKLFGKAAALLSVNIAAIYLSAPHIAKVGNVKEQYMIAFMVMAAAFWIVYEWTDKKRWLLLTGAALIWPYYFKATGLTIDIAFVLYFLGRAWLLKYPLRRFQKEFWLLLGGAVLGIVPLYLFFLWQRQTPILMNSFPILILKAAVVLNGVGLALVYARKIHLMARVRQAAGQVRPIVWAGGIAVLGLTIMLACLILYWGTRPYPYPYWDHLRSYLGSLFLVRWPMGWYLRLSSFWQTLAASAGTDSMYIFGSRQAYSLSKQAPIVLRYYASLSLPIVCSLLSLMAAAGISIRRKWTHKTSLRAQDRLVWLLGMWWVLDMAFVWISPRSYEQYYLPLCASGAMLSGYGVWLAAGRFSKSPARGPYVFGFIATGAVMAAMVWPLIFGYSKSTFTGQPYVSPEGRPERRRGYVQALKLVRSGPGDWQKIGRYIREHTEATERIYVWGWYPGIYVVAQRLAPVPRAFESNMHTMAPRQLAGMIQQMAQQFEEDPPAFIVDTRKRHFPWDRPPLELWPIVQTRQDGQVRPRYAPNDPAVLAQFEASYKAALEQRFGPEEAARFEAMKPLRDFVMNHYRIVQELSWPNSPHVLLERK